MAFDVPGAYQYCIYPEPDELGQYLYHVAPRSERARIETEGLDVDESKTHNTGDDNYYTAAEWEQAARTPDTDHGHWRPHGVYLFPQIEQAIEYASADDDLYVIAVDNSLDLIRDPSVAMNWEFSFEHHAYVIEQVPHSQYRRVPEQCMDRALALWNRYQQQAAASWKSDDADARAAARKQADLAYHQAINQIAYAQQDLFIEPGSVAENTLEL